jgi:hypothetical protein
MKKYILTIVAIFIISMAMAQAPQEGPMPEMGNKGKTEMAQKRTDKMVKKYGLNEKQAKELLSLNIEYQGKLNFPGGKKKERRMQMCNCPCCRMMMTMMQEFMKHRGMEGYGIPEGDGPRQMGKNDRRMPHNMCNEMKDSTNGPRFMDHTPQIHPNDTTIHKNRMRMERMEQKMDKKEMGGNMEEHKIAKEEYETKLAKIMNKKQYADYKTNTKNKQKRIKGDNKRSFH